MAKNERNLPVGTTVALVQELTDAPVGTEVIHRPRAYCSMAPSDLTYVKEAHGWRGTNRRSAPQTSIPDTAFARGIDAGCLHWVPEGWQPRG